jgi:hypothetical protein
MAFWATIEVATNPCKPPIGNSLELLYTFDRMVNVTLYS